MGRKGVNIPNEVKLKYAKLCFENKMSKKEVARQLGVCDGDVISWVYRYREQGKSAFLEYNNGIDFSHKRSGRSRMKASRNTTKEECTKIVSECLEDGFNYGETAIKYNVSCQQVYCWVKCYKELVEAGLEDRRGKHNVAQEPRADSAQQ